MKTILILIAVFVSMYYIDPIIQSHLRNTIITAIEGDLE